MLTTAQVESFERRVNWFAATTPVGYLSGDVACQILRINCSLRSTVRSAFPHFAEISAFESSMSATVLIFVKLGAPPVGACSAATAEHSPVTASAVVQPSVSRLTDAVYEPTANQPVNDQLAIFTPVQPPPQHLMSRKQQRVQKKLLERKLGKG